jgi:hypothetical protein
MAERVRQGPCGVPACPEPEKASGQWAYIPEGNEKEVARGAHCVCKKADCLRYFGLKEEAQRPGRKTKRPASPDAPGRDDPCLPAMYSVRRIDEIWGHRRARRNTTAAARAACCSRPPTALARGRFANLAALDDDERRNKMPVKKYRTEYMVHGLFGKLGTENGFYGAYWMPVRRVAGDVGRVALELELEIFEQQQSDWRTEDLDKWEEEEAEEETE